MERLNIDRETKKRLIRIRHSMYCRCFYPNTHGYKNYGGRGIKICDNWLNNPNSFYKWAIENGYENNLTLDRIDVNGDYCPENCKWTTRKEQSRNTRTNRYYTYNGQTKTQIEWCEQYNICPVTFSDRLNRGWSLEQALTIPTKGTHRKVK